MAAGRTPKASAGRQCRQQTAMVKIPRFMGAKLTRLSAAAMRSGNQTDLADVAPLADEPWASGRVEGEGLGDDRAELALLKLRDEGFRHPARLPSLSHQCSMLRPKTPLFSLIIERLFHHGIVASGVFITAFAATSRLRFSPVETSLAP